MESALCQTSRTQRTATAPAVANGYDGAMRDEFKKGDAVEWKSSGGKVEGEVVKKLTEDTKIKSHQVRASKDDPEYLVESDTTGAKAAHKPDALEKK